VDEHE
jgi:abhydrolase domain-containing protein 5